MKIPYSRLELNIALLGIDEKEVTDEKQEKFIKEMESFYPKDKSSLNKRIAKHNGIGVMDLINSPNYAILCKEYQRIMVGEAIQKIKKEFNLTDKQAWATFAAGSGLLD